MDIAWDFRPEEQGLRYIFEDYCLAHRVKYKWGKQHGTGLYYIEIFALNDVGEEAWITLSSPQPLDRAIEHALEYLGHAAYVQKKAVGLAGEILDEK